MDNADEEKQRQEDLETHRTKLSVSLQMLQYHVWHDGTPMKNRQAPFRYNLRKR